MALPKKAPQSARPFRPVPRRALAAALLLCGCAILPDYVGPELTHASHINQHLGPDPTNYDSDSLGVTAEWSKAPGPYLQLHDGVTL